MVILSTLLLGFSLLHATAFALPGTVPSTLAPRADPDDIMIFDCTDYKSRSLQDLCMSMCFGAFCAGNGESLTWDKPSASTARARARAAGCRPTPNRCSKSPYGSDFECDEYPFKSVEDISGGTRVNRCVPKQQNQDQAQIIKAYYASSSGCNGKAPCNFNVGFSNSGEMKYCNQETCVNDGNEFTKGGEYSRRRRDGSGDTAAIEYVPLSNTSSPFAWETRFATTNGTQVTVPSGARVGQKAVTMAITDFELWDAYIQETIAAEANMTEAEYWEQQVAPADARLMELITFTETTIAETK